MIRNEDGLLTGYVYVDFDGADYGRYIADADRIIKQAVTVPTGYVVAWTGEYERLLATRRQLTEVVPLTLSLILLLLYVSTRSLPRTFIVLLAVPFSAVGAIWTLYVLGYHVSIGVWAGLIALLGVDAETGVFMLWYLDEAYDRAKRERRLDAPGALEQAVLDGASRRVRPKVMTVATMFVGLLPIMWSTGTGSDLMKRIAAPLIGGIFTSFVLELILYPVIYYSWKARSRP
jgi:Cu(I)/Ag(I) efflux system membrane protein CusA/SilA